MGARQARDRVPQLLAARGLCRPVLHKSLGSIVCPTRSAAAAASVCCCLRQVDRDWELECECQCEWEWERERWLDATVAHTKLIKHLLSTARWQCCQKKLQLKKDNKQ